MTVLVVDGANVFGSRPDGWWRDRRAAATRLRDHLEGFAGPGLPGVPGPLRIVLVLEGAARGIGSGVAVEVVDAPASGDDAIVLEASASEPPVVVVTADRELRMRILLLGGRVVGPNTVWGS